MSRLSDAIAAGRNPRDYKLELAKDFGNGLSAGAGVTFNDANRDFYTPAGKRTIAKDTGYVFAKYTF